MAEPAALVTGASGFVGRHLVRALLDDGVRPTVLARPGSRLPEDWSGRVDSVRCDDWSEGGLARALEGCDFGVVYHLAAYGVHPNDRDAASMEQINVRLPGSMVRLCADRSAVLVMAGSSAEYAPPAAQTPVDENAPLETTKLYGATKAHGGMLANGLANDAGVPFRLLRLFNVYGAGEAPHRLLPNLLNGLSEGRRVPLSAGAQVRDFVHVSDAVSALLVAANGLLGSRAVGSSVVNVCTGSGRSVREFADGVAEALDADSGLLGFGDIPMRPDDVPWLVGDPARAVSELGWRAAMDLSEGILRTLGEWKTNDRSGRASAMVAPV